jgi:hypothetical protein
MVQLKVLESTLICMSGNDKWNGSENKMLSLWVATSLQWCFSTINKNKFRVSSSFHASVSVCVCLHFLLICTSLYPVPLPLQHWLISIFEISYNSHDHLHLQPDCQNANRFINITTIRKIHLVGFKWEISEGYL